MKLVDRADPFHIMIAPDTNPEPFTAIVNDGVPAGAEFGLRLDSESAPDGLMVNVSAVEVAPPGFCTVTLAVPCDAMSAADTDAVNWLALTKVAGRADPFHCTVDPLTNPDPFTVRVNAAPPAVAEFGLRLDSEGPELPPAEMIWTLVALPRRQWLKSGLQKRSMTFPFDKSNANVPLSIVVVITPLRLPLRTAAKLTTAAHAGD
jgi:hypothetical protein